MTNQRSSRSPIQ